MQYFVRVTAGLEQVAWQEIQQCPGVILLGYGHRRIDFAYDGPLDPLLGIKSVDDVYVFITQLHGFDRTRASLAVFQQLKNVTFKPALNAVSALRRVGKPPTYGITASYLGRRNYSRYDIEAAVQTVLADRLPWRFMPYQPDEDPTHDLELRILVEDDWALVGLRLGRVPLHRRPYKTASMPGSLKAPVAYCLCMLADLKPRDTLLDPTCGAGTILIEAAESITQGVLVGIDSAPEAIRATHQNGVAAGLNTEVIGHEDLAVTLDEVPREDARSTVVLWEGDARDVVVPEGVLQAVVTNLPWGKQVEPNADVFQLYAGIVRLIDTGLDSTGRAVILTDQVDALQAALQPCSRLTLVSAFQISLFGSHPTVHVLRKQ